MADHINHIFFKTPKLLEHYDIEAITEQPPFDEMLDYIDYESRWDAMSVDLTLLFNFLNFSPLEFLLNGMNKGYPRMEIEDTQIVFSKAEQIQVVKDIKDLFSKILVAKNQFLDDRKIYQISDYQLYIEKSIAMTEKELKQGIFEDTNKEGSDSLIYFIELLKRFFQASIEHNMTVIKYAY